MNRSKITADRLEGMHLNDLLIFKGQSTFGLEFNHTYKYRGLTKTNGHISHVSTSNDHNIQESVFTKHEFLTLFVHA